MYKGNKGANGKIWKNCENAVFWHERLDNGFKSEKYFHTILIDAHNDIRVRNVECNEREKKG